MRGVYYKTFIYLRIKYGENVHERFIFRYGKCWNIMKIMIKMKIPSTKTKYYPARLFLHPWESFSSWHDVCWIIRHPWLRHSQPPYLDSYPWSPFPLKLFFSQRHLYGYTFSTIIMTNKIWEGAKIKKNSSRFFVRCLHITFTFEIWDVVFLPKKRCWSWMKIWKKKANWDGWNFVELNYF